LFLPRFRQCQGGLPWLIGNIVSQGRVLRMLPGVILLFTAAFGGTCLHRGGGMRKILAFLLVLAFGAFPSWASLGLSERSVHEDQQRMSGQLRSATFDGYTVHEISGAGGVVVREYVSPVGNVFGVVWDGPTMPDLSHLLGPYYSQYQQAVASARSHRGPLFVQAGPLTVESGGHLPAFHGRAFVASLIPANLTKDVIR